MVSKSTYKKIRQGCGFNPSEPRQYEIDQHLRKVMVEVRIPRPAKDAPKLEKIQYAMRKTFSRLEKKQLLLKHYRCTGSRDEYLYQKDIYRRLTNKAKKELSKRYGNSWYGRLKETDGTLYVMSSQGQLA